MRTQGRLFKLPHCFEAHGWRKRSTGVKAQRGETRTDIIEHKPVNLRALECAGAGILVQVIGAGVAADLGAGSAVRRATLAGLKVLRLTSIVQALAPCPESQMPGVRRRQVWVAGAPCAPRWRA